VAFVERGHPPAADAAAVVCVPAGERESCATAYDTVADVGLAYVEGEHPPAADGAVAVVCVPNGERERRATADDEVAVVGLAYVEREHPPTVDDAAAVVGVLPASKSAARQQTTR